MGAGEEEEDTMSSAHIQSEKIRPEGKQGEAPARQRPRPLAPGGRAPPSHWPGGRCPSRASSRPTGGVPAGEVVTSAMVDHGDGGSSLQGHRRGQRSEDERAREELRENGVRKTSETSENKQEVDRHFENTHIDRIGG